MDLLAVRTKECVISFTDIVNELKSKIEEVEKREEELGERECAFEESIAKCNDLKDTQTVKFNVGGRVFMFSVQQIQAYPESMLACLISKRWNNDSDKLEFDIPRSGRLFAYIDDFLKLGKVNVDPDDVELLAIEAEYYALEVLPWHLLANTHKNDISSFTNYKHYE